MLRGGPCHPIPALVRAAWRALPSDPGSGPCCVACLAIRSRLWSVLRGVPCHPIPALVRAAWRALPSDPGSGGLVVSARRQPAGPCQAQYTNYLLHVMAREVGTSRGGSQGSA